MKLASKLKHLLIRSTNVSGSTSTTWIRGSSQVAQSGAPWIQRVAGQGLGHGDEASVRGAGPS